MRLLVAFAVVQDIVRFYISVDEAALMSSFQYLNVLTTLKTINDHIQNSVKILFNSSAVFLTTFDDLTLVSIDTFY